MALTLVQNCPHCRSVQIGFTLAGAGHTHNSHQYYGWSLLFSCNKCRKPVCVTGYTENGRFGPYDASGDIKDYRDFQVSEIIPKSEPVDAPDHCPGNIGHIFIQAEEALARNHFDSSLAMDRRALELMSKNIAPEIKGNLFERIEYLANAHLITPALKEWAHQLRQYGNDAVHEIDSPTPDDARSMHDLTRFILTYIYTLPEQVRLANEKRDTAKQQ